MKRLVCMLFCATALLAGDATFAAKNLLPNRIASGQTVRCADQSRGKWCDATDNPPPAWDGRPIRRTTPYPQQNQQVQQGNPCAQYSGNARVLCEQSGTLAPALGTIFGR